MAGSRQVVPAHAERAGGTGSRALDRRHFDEGCQGPCEYWTGFSPAHSELRLILLCRAQIHVEQLSVFLFRDGTVVSFSQDSGYHHQISQIFERIQSRDDLLRDSQDASFILQALLDVTADDALDIIDEFRDQLTNLESRVLSRPDMDDVRHLHILSSQLLLLKSTLTPLQLLLQALRSQDDAKAAAAFRIETPNPYPQAPAPRPDSTQPYGGGGEFSRIASPAGRERERGASRSRGPGPSSSAAPVEDPFADGMHHGLGGGEGDLRKALHEQNLPPLPPPPYQQRKGFVSHEAKV